MCQLTVTILYACISLRKELRIVRLNLPRSPASNICGSIAASLRTISAYRDSFQLLLQVAALREGCEVANLIEGHRIVWHNTLRTLQEWFAPVGDDTSAGANDLNSLREVGREGKMLP